VHGDKWKKATVLKKDGEQSYLVKTSNGQIYRRNRKYLRSTNESMEPDDSSSTEEDAADELYIPTTEDQQTSTNQTNGTSEGQPSSDQSRTLPENNTRPSVIVT